MAEKSQKVTVESFDIPCSFEAAADPTKDGRLARLTYEFPTADTLNRNFRVYPKDVMAPAVEALNTDAGRGRIFGRLDHPSSYSEAAYSPTISDAAVRCVSCEMVGSNKVRVVLDVLKNQHGQQLMSCIEGGGNPAISQRALAVWDSPTEADRVAYGLAKDSNAEIARSLRLVCYDVVAQPGFDTADKPVVTEGLDPMWKTADEVKTAAPEIYNVIFNAGKASIDVAKLTSEAVEAQKPKITEEAVRPLSAELATLKADKTKLEGVIVGLKKVLTDAGVAVETISDKEVERRLADQTRLATESAAALATAKSDLDKANSKLAELNAKQVTVEALAEIRTKYTGHKHIGLIEKACEGITDKGKALDAAAAKAAEILSIVGPEGIKTKTEEKKADETIADPNAVAGANGKAGDPANESRNKAAGAAILGAKGVPSRPR